MNFYTPSSEEAQKSDLSFGGLPPLKKKPEEESVSLISHRLQEALPERNAPLSKKRIEVTTFQGATTQAQSYRNIFNKAFAIAQGIVELEQQALRANPNAQEQLQQAFLDAQGMAECTVKQKELGLAIVHGNTHFDEHSGVGFIEIRGSVYLFLGEATHEQALNYLTSSKEIAPEHKEKAFRDLKRVQRNEEPQECIIVTPEDAESALKGLDQTFKHFAAGVSQLINKSQNSAKETLLRTSKNLPVGTNVSPRQRTQEHVLEAIEHSGLHLPRTGRQQSQETMENQKARLREEYFEAMQIEKELKTKERKKEEKRREGDEQISNKEGLRAENAYRSEISGIKEDSSEIEPIQ